MTNKKVNNSWNTEKTRTMILCSLLGIFGVHKFYQGKTAQGVIFILLDITIIGILITAIWAFINLIQLTINKKNTDKEFIVGIVLLLLNFIYSYTTIKNTEYNIYNVDEIKLQQAKERTLQKIEKANQEHRTKTHLKEKLQK